MVRQFSRRTCATAVLALAVACGAVPTPTAPTPPPIATVTAPAITATQFRLDVTPSVTCQTVGSGLFQTNKAPFHTHQLLMTRSELDASGMVLRQPFYRPWPFAAPIAIKNNGDVTLNVNVDVYQPTGTLIGGGFTDESSYLTLFYATKARTAAASLTIIGSGENGERWGTMSGFLSYSIYLTAGGGACEAPAHTWHLTPVG